MTASSLPPGALVRLALQRRQELTPYTFEDLLSEVLGRLLDGENPANTQQRIALGDAIHELLADRLNVHENRFSVRRLRDLFYTLFLGVPEPRPAINDSVILDLGAGSHNPLGLLFVFLMLGASKGIALDLEDTQDPQRAVRAMARSADVMCTAPKRIAHHYPVSPSQVQQRLATFDLERMHAGDPAGIDSSKLRLLQGSASEIPLDSCSVDIVISNSFLEHVENAHLVVQEVRRILKPGGFSIHNIDTVDHWSYGNHSLHPLAFLTLGDAGLAHGSNRIRLLEFPEIFTASGFSVTHLRVSRRLPIDSDFRNSLAPPWRSMPQEWLESLAGTMVTKRESE
jgi:SAM-dependent methyltransferase